MGGQREVNGYITHPIDTIVGGTNLRNLEYGHDECKDHAKGHEKIIK